MPGSCGREGVGHSESDEELKELQAELVKAKEELNAFEKMGKGDKVPLKASESKMKEKVRELEERIRDLRL